MRAFDVPTIEARECLLAWVLVLICVVLLFMQAPHGGGFYWSDRRVMRG